MANEVNCEKRNEKDDRVNSTVFKFRRFLSQFMATTVENMLLFDMGLLHAFPFIVIAALTGFPNKHNLNETLTLTPEQASWLGSIGYVSEPFGSLVSAMITDTLGRKSAMMVVNIPLVVAWFMMYNSTTVWEIFVANTLLGFGAGLMESPIITYVGEICEPTFRGIMIAFTHVGWTLGMILVATLNTLMPWRMVALVCMFIPILTTIALLFVPETPLWLLSKNRVAAAEKALCWLRGWVKEDDVSTEFQALQRYSQRYKSCDACIKSNQICTHPPPTFREKMVELKRRQTRRPFIIVMALFIIGSFCGTFALSTYIVQILQAYNIPMEPDKAAAVLSYVNNLGNISFLCLIRLTGKRKLYLTMLSVSFLSSAVVCVYGFVVLPVGYSSFQDIATNFVPENSNLGYIPFVCIITASFAMYCGIHAMPWQMVSEVFPYKTRGTATGLTAAISYILTFVSTKTYYFLETTLSMPGIALFNCVIAIMGIVLMYYILPETENRTLEEIELHFADGNKKITDRTITKIKMRQAVWEKSQEQPVKCVPAQETDVSFVERGCENEGFTDDK